MPSWLKGMLLGHNETVEGVNVYVRRDNVERVTYYYHPSSLHSSFIWHYNKVTTPFTHPRGMYPYVKRYDSGKVDLHVEVESGDNINFGFCDTLVVNIQGKLLSHKGPSKKHEYWEKRICVDVLCDGEWLASLKELARGGVTVVRFKTTPDLQYDYKVQEWNKKLVAEMLQVYEALMPKQADESRPSPAPMPQQLSPAQPEGSAVRYGPFDFYPNGFVTAFDGAFRMHAGVPIQEIEIQGHKLKSSDRGGFIVVHPDGAKFEIEFREGQVRRRPLVPTPEG